MGSVIIVVSFGVFVWALIGLVSPGRVGIPTRAASVAVWLVSVVLLFFGALMLPEDSSTPGSTDGGQRAASAPSAPETFRTRIERALGNSNRDVFRVNAARLQGEQLFVQWAINDNLTANMRQNGAKIEVSEILESIAASSETYTSVLLRGTFSMVDQLGNASERPVVEVTYTRDTISRINFENFLFENVYAIAEDASIHPEFR